MSASDVAIPPVPPGAPVITTALGVVVPGQGLQLNMQCVRRLPAPANVHVNMRAALGRTCPPPALHSMAAPGVFVCEIPAPKLASHISVFIQPGQALDPAQGLLIHWAYQPFDNWMLLGVLQPGVSADIFATNWPDKLAPDCSVVRLACSIVPATTVENVAPVSALQTLDRLSFARLVAKNLFDFMGSYAQSTASGEQLVVPAGVLDVWYTRFEAKLRQDPGFLYVAK